MIATRPMQSDDRPFVVSGWSSSYRSSLDETAPASLYAKHKHEEVGFYLDRCRTLVAHGEIGVLFGFVAFDPTVYVAKVHNRRVTLDGYILYLYVAAPFRRRGIARRLLAGAGISPLSHFGYAYRTQWSWDLRAKIPNAQHEPKRARYEEITNVRSTAETGAAEGQQDPDQDHLAP